MRIRRVMAVLTVLAFAVPVWAHCGKCGVGDAKDKHGEGTHAHAHAQIGSPAPSFTLKDTSGKEFKLADMKGKVVVLEWTNHLCPFVKRHQSKDKTMQTTLAKYKDKPVVWVAVDSSYFCLEKKDGILSWLKETELPYPVLLDQKGEVGSTYGAKSTPHMFVIDQKGVLAYSGAIDDDPYGNKNERRNYVEEAIDALLQGSKVAVSMTKSYGCAVKYKK